jgi:hypothetical protein
MQRVEPTQFIPAHKPDRVSVWTLPDQVTIVSNPGITGDSLTGVVLEAPWAVPLKDILRVEAQQSDPKRTALLMAGAAATGIGLYFVTTSGKGTTTIPCDASLTPELQAELCGGER